MVPDGVPYDGDNLVDDLMYFLTLGNDDFLCDSYFWISVVKGVALIQRSNLLPSCHMRSTFVKFPARRKC